MASAGRPANVKARPSSRRTSGNLAILRGQALEEGDRFVEAAGHVVELGHLACHFQRQRIAIERRLQHPLGVGVPLLRLQGREAVADVGRHQTRIERDGVLK